MRLRLKKMPTILFLTLFIVTIALTSVRGENADLSVEVYTVDGKPLKDAYVKVIKDTTSVGSGKTGPDGKISFSLPKNNTYDVIVYYPSGHQVGSERVTFNETMTVKIKVDVVSKWTIYVYDRRERDPVQGANVTVIHKTNKSIAYWKLTDSGGKVEFGPIPTTSNYNVIVRYGAEEYGAGDRAATIELKLALPLYRVELVIFDKKGRPVGDVVVELRKELGERPVISGTSNVDGKITLKLVPVGNYYLTAWLRGVKVYESDSKEIQILNNDFSKEISVNAAKLNVTVLDYDGESKISQYNLVGRLLRAGKEIGKTSSEDGVLRFGHVPFENYTLEVKLEDLIMFSGTYEVKLESAEGAIKASFYDVTLEINASALANQTLAKSLKVELRKDQVEIRGQAKEGRLAMSDVPGAEGYLVTLFYQDREVGKIPNVNISREDQVVRLNLTGYAIRIITLTLDEKPVSADIDIRLLSGEKVVSIKTGSDGRGSSGLLLPLIYTVSASLNGIIVGEQTITLISDIDLPMKLSVMDVAFKIFDKDNEEALTNIDIKLLHDTFELRGIGDESGAVRFENVPVTHYRLVVNYHGFKVLDQFIEINPSERMAELQAPGVLDVKLTVLDALKKPLDQGTVILLFGDSNVSKEISPNGEVLVKNLPNTTISIRALYKDVSVDVDPATFDLLVDDMRVVCTTAVYTLAVKVVRGDGGRVSEGEVVISADGKVMAVHDLKSGSSFSERLPKGYVDIRVKYRGRDAGFMDIYVDQTIKDIITVYSTLYPFRVKIYSPDGTPVEGALIIVKDELGEIDRSRSGSDGLVETILPTGDYNVTIQVENKTYSFNFKLEASYSVNLLCSAPKSPGLEISIIAGAINLMISGLALSRAPRARPRPRRPPERRVAGRPRRRIPRI